VEEEKSTPSNPVYKPITLPDFQNGNVTQPASSDYWPSLRCVEPVVFAYFSDLNRP